MTLRFFEWREKVPRAILLAVAMSLVPLPAAAAEKGSDPKPGPIKAAVAKIGRTGAMPAPAARGTAAARRQQSSGEGRDASFFKTKAGVLTLLVMAVGVGYAVYSTSNDRITSPGKE